MTYYIKGGSRFNAANPTVWVALNLVGFADSKYLDANWKQIDYESIIDAQDPFWLFGSTSGGAKEAEFGLYNDYRIKFDVSGIYGWNGSGWTDILALGGASALGDLTDVVISAPADNEVLAWDNGSNTWINQTPAEAGLATTGDLHAEAHTHDTDTLQLDGVNSDGGAFSFTTSGAVTFSQAVNTQALDVTGNITVSGTVDGVDIADRDHAPTVAGDLNHNDLANIDAGDIKHLTAAQVAALHATYTDAEAHAYIEANALVITGGLQMSGVNITMAGAETVDGVDISALSITNMPTAVNNWKMFATNGSGVMTELAVGAATTVLTGNGVGAAPSFQAAAAGGGVTVGAAFPGGPDDGDLFYHTGDEAMYLWSDDAAAWLQVGGAGSSAISDDVYGVGWNGETEVAPSKNAVYDKMETEVSRIDAVELKGHTAMITPSSNRDPGGSVYVPIAFDNDYDSDDGVVEANSANNRVIAKGSAWYLITCTLRWLSYNYAPGTANHRLTKNGVVMGDTYFTLVWQTTTNYNMSVSFTTVKELSANDYIQVETSTADIDARVIADGSNLTLTRLT